MFRNWRDNRRLAAELEDTYYKRSDDRMSIMEPPPDHENNTAVLDDEPVAVPDTVPVTGQAFRDTCADCKRPLMEMEPGRYVHLDANIDQTGNPAWHLARLFVETPIPWGFLNTSGQRSGFTVDPKKQWK